MILSKVWLDIVLIASSIILIAIASVALIWAIKIIIVLISDIKDWLE